MSINTDKLNRVQMIPASLGTGYVHPATIQEFESLYRKEYADELDSCDRWIKWCESQTPADWYGINFHKGMRAALVFGNIKMEQFIRVLKQETPKKLTQIANHTKNLNQEK